MPLCDQAAVLAKLLSSMAFCCQQAVEMSVTQICANRSNSGRSETLYIYIYICDVYAMNCWSHRAGKQVAFCPINRAIIIAKVI